MRNKQSLIICFLLVLALLTVGTASAGIITVNNSTGQVADYTSIQAAVDAAVNGDMILVYPGFYEENVDVSQENIIITSESGNPDNAIVQAEFPNDNVFYVKADNVTINGFTIKGAIDIYREGIRVDSSNDSTLSNNVISGNYYGILISDSNDNILSNNVVSGNTNVGIYLYSSNDNMLSNNNALNNNEGFILLHTNDSTLSDNVASGNGQNGIILDSSNDNILSNNVVSGNSQNGIYLGSSNDNLIYNNIFSNSNNVNFLGINSGNIWNITQTLETNIIGGSYLGGNYWAYPNGTGFSQVGEDLDGDGICDSSYDIDERNTDYLPLYLPTPIEETENLKKDVNGLDEGVADSTKHVLNVKLDGVINNLDKGDNDKAIKKIENFIKFVDIKKRQDKLGDNQAEYLINEANSIIQMIQN